MLNILIRAGLHFLEKKTISDRVRASVPSVGRIAFFFVDQMD